MRKLILIVLGLTMLMLGACTIEENSVESISITGVQEVWLDEIITLEANVMPATASQDVRWSSSDESIAIVDAFGNVIPQKVGTVTIKATHSVDSRIESTIIIVVKDQSIPQEMAYYHTKILSIHSATRRMELEDVPYQQYTEDTVFLKRVGTNVVPMSSTSLYIGLDNVYVEVDPQLNVITKVIMDQEIGFSNIRVAIRKSIDDISQLATLYHDSVELYPRQVSTMKIYDGSLQVSIPANSTIQIDYVDGKIRVQNGSNTLISTEKRIVLKQTGSAATEIRSIRRALGIPSYQGNIEISIVNGRLLVVNDVNLENYLTKVVPSEMPSSFHSEALKSQAVAARTYAYMDILRRTNEQYGFSVDDSVSSQVYNNQNTNSNTSMAVYQTAGLIMMNQGIPIQAYYYSTSSGLTASAHEVWITNQPIDEIEYLIGKNLTNDGSGQAVPANYEDEASMLDFFKQITMETPDLNATQHRWKIDITKVQLKNILNTNLKSMYQQHPNSILTYAYGVGEWRSETIPSDIGEVYDIYVGRRGTSGVVMSLVIETSSGTYQIWNQYNIRFTIRPKDGGSTIVRYGAKYSDSIYTSTQNNISILPSGFFAIETSGDTYSFYGGGNGHGVGMSQYGAHGLGSKGYTYIQILETYYSNTDLVDISYQYSKVSNFQSWF
ncbi:MAG TPA: SpoIID/LytB domain-containing protein [Bacilli bacterium]|nr:SpoIID/LytB domain-containing protein [Bacilli bacterium]